MSVAASGLAHSIHTRLIRYAKSSLPQELRSRMVGEILENLSGTPLLQQT